MNKKQERGIKCNRQIHIKGCVVDQRKKKRYGSYVVMNRNTGCGSKIPLVILQEVSSF